MQIPNSLRVMKQCHCDTLCLAIFAVTNSTADPTMLFACFYKAYIGCSTSRAAAHIMVRPVMGQDKAGMQPCVAVNKTDDYRRAALQKAQKSSAEVICVTEQSIAEKKQKQQVIDYLLTSPTNQLVESQTKSGSKDVDARIGLDSNHSILLL